MFERSAGPPVFGLIFLTAVAGSVVWAATAETDPVIEPPTPVAIDAPEPPAGAARSRTAEFNRRTSPAS